MEKTKKKDVPKEEILNDKRVIAEIRRHLWLESEKAGYDIGFEKAKEDWLENFSKAWMKYHMPDITTADKASATPKNTSGSKSKTAAKKSGSLKRRRAKSYF